MNRHLADATEREAEWRERLARAERQAERDKVTLPGAGVAREIQSAVRSLAGARSEWERDALASMVAERLYSRPAESGTPRQVLAWIDRCERFPTLAHREWERAAVRGTGRTHIRLIVSEIMRDSRAWLDVAASHSPALAAQHRKRARAQSNTGPMILPLADMLSESGEPVGYLAVALAGSPLTAEPHVCPDSLARVASAVVAWKRATGELSESESRNVLTFLRAGLPESGDSPRGALSLATELGVSYGTLRNRVSAGRKVAARLWESRAAMVAEIAESAESMGYLALAPTDTYRLSLAERRAERLAQAAHAQAREWVAGRTASGRQSGGIAARAARRNWRAAGAQRYSAPARSPGAESVRELAPIVPQPASASGGYRPRDSRREADAKRLAPAPVWGEAARAVEAAHSEALRMEAARVGAARSKASEWDRCCAEC